MRLVVSKERLSVTETDFIQRLSSQAVLERIEKSGERHFVLWIPEASEFYCVVAADDKVITLMPLIWRARQVSESVLAQARNAVDNAGTTTEYIKIAPPACTPSVSNPTKATVYCTYLGLDRAIKFRSDAFDTMGRVDESRFRDELVQSVSRIDFITNIRAQYKKTWTDLTHLLPIPVDKPTQST